MKNKPSKYNSKYNKEDLIHSLPDYIKRNIDDKNLIDAIEKELESDPGFRLEMNEIQNTLGFLNSAELESPPESYFNNLPVKINDKINESFNPEKSASGLWARAGMFWKILLPSIPVVIVAIILLSRYNNDQSVQLSPDKNENNAVIQNENITEHNENELSDIEPEFKSDENITEEQPADIDKSTNRKKIISTDRNKISSDKTVLSGTNGDSTGILSGTILSELSDDTGDLFTGEQGEDILFSVESDDEIMEDEFFDLTPEQQEEVLKSLKESNI